METSSTDPKPLLPVSGGFYVYRAYKKYINFMKADLPKYISLSKKVELGKNCQICLKEVDECVVSLLKSGRSVSVNLSSSRRENLLPDGR